MALAITGTSGKSGGAGTVTSVTATDTSIVVAGTAAAPTVATGTLDAIAAAHAPAANWSNNSKKITSLANGSGAQDAAAFGQIPTALPPNGSASGDLGGSYPSPTVVTGAHLGAATVPIASLADPTTGKVIGSASSAAAAVFPPGYEINYTQITSTVSVISTTEASGTTIISPGAITFDGAAVMVEFYAAAIELPTATAASNSVVVNLFEGSTQIGRLCVCLLQDLASGQNYRVPACGCLRFTPTSGSHTYTVTAYASSTTGAPSIDAGAGGTGVVVPAFVRFTKV